MAQSFLVNGGTRSQVTVVFRGTAQNSGAAVVSVVPRLRVFVAGALQGVVEGSVLSLTPGGGPSSINLRGLLDVTVSSFPVGEVTAEASLTEVTRGVVVQAIASGPMGVSVIDVVDTPLGLVLDTITIPHVIRLCQPVPGPFTSAAIPASTNCGVYTRSLADFPPNILPSGGNSGVVSASEMIMVIGEFGRDGGPSLGNASIHVMFWKPGKVLYDSTSYSPNPAFPYIWVAAIIGHFDGEITEPGIYYCGIGTPWGGAQFAFQVI